MQHSRYSLFRRCLFNCLLLTVCVGCMVPCISVATRLVPAHSGALARSFKGNHLLHWGRFDVPSSSLCQSMLLITCYSPAELRKAYSITAAINSGLTGAGQTIVIVDSFGSPTIQQDLKQFDADYGLPDPPSFQVLAPFGSVPFDPSDAGQIGWAEESSLDVQWAHAMAPGANLVLLTSPVSETQGVEGMPQFLALEAYALQHNLGQIIAQSWGTTENTLFTSVGHVLLNGFNALYKGAALNHVSVFAASGDSGAANVDVNGNIYAFPTVDFPASSAWVTAVGGTSLHTNLDGSYQSESAWSGSGGGVSQYFSLPAYQQHNLSPGNLTLLNGYRGVPDIASNADPATGMPVYLGFLPADQTGYWIFGGTSAGVPVWSGLTADANQRAGHPLGFLNDQLYRFGSNGHNAAKVLHDVADGNNSQSGVTGYSAVAGWDPVTGWGSANGYELLKILR